MLAALIYVVTQPLYMCKEGLWSFDHPKASASTDVFGSLLCLHDKRHIMLA